MTNNQAHPDIYYAVAHREQKELDSFKTRYQDFDTSLIPAIFKQSMNLDVVSFKPSKSWGTSHVIYFVKTKQRPDELVLRANLGVNPLPEVVMLTEKLITDRVNALGVPTNQVITVDISRREFPFDFQIQEKLVGQDLEDHFHGTQAEYDRMSYELGELVAKIHTIKLPGFGRFSEAAAVQNELKGSKASLYDYIIVNLDNDLQYLRQAEVISSPQVEQILRLFADHQAIINLKQGVLVHHDLADHNLMFKDNQITGIFDWEAAVVADPVLDLASCPLWKTHFPREKQLVAGYRSVSALPDHFQDKWDIFMLRTMIWKMVFAIRIKILNEERKNRFLQALKPFHL